MRGQSFYFGKDSYKKIADVLAQAGATRPMLVCGNNSFDALGISHYLQALPVQFTRFSKFAPNPVYESAIDGVKVLKENCCDFIFAVGGGSAIDTAKCIRRFAGMDAGKNYLEQTTVQKTVPLAAMPTTAGTGSESTHFAVIYYQGKKYSVAGEDVLPEYVILDPAGLYSIPEYQKKACYLDALCQAIESWWSIRANPESICYAKKAIGLLLQNREAYFSGDKTVYEDVLLGANYAGRAINITTTTAAHAMSYKLTSLYGLAHGHAVALCLPEVWQAMLDYDNAEAQKKFRDIAGALGYREPEKAIAWFRDFLHRLNMTVPKAGEEDIPILAKSVNLQRLQNNPVPFDSDDITEIYMKILG